MRARTAFPLARSLPSTASAAAGASPAALFGRFFGTTPRSDFPRPWLIVVRPKASRCALRQTSPDVPQQDAGSPGSRARCFRACAGSVTARGPMQPCRGGCNGVAFGVAPPPRHPDHPRTNVRGHGLRGSIPGPRVPLSTLGSHPHEGLRRTVLTLVMFPVLVARYVRLALGEERESAGTFGNQLERYAECTPRFVPKPAPSGPARHQT